jgi:hypothetical protein
MQALDRLVQRSYETGHKNGWTWAKRNLLEEVLELVEYVIIKLLGNV